VAFDFGSILKFTLDDDADGTHTNGQEYNDMDLGPWPLVAHIPTGWRVKDFTCADPDSGSTVDKANAKATIDLDAGETIRCNLSIEPIPAPPPPPPAGLCNGKVATITGGAGATTIRGTPGNDVIIDLDGAERHRRQGRQRHDLHRARQRRHRRRQRLRLDQRRRRREHRQRRQRQRRDLRRLRQRPDRRRQGRRSLRPGRWHEHRQELRALSQPSTTGVGRTPGPATTFDTPRRPST
jgi:hypothetical protein